MGCFAGLVRCFMLIFNFACLVVAIILISVGSVFYISVHYYEKLIDEVEGIKTVPTLTIVVGVIIFVVAFFGCCGARRHNLCMLKTYAAMLVILVILQVSIGIYGLAKTKYDYSNEKIHKGLRKSFKRYDKDPVMKDVFQSIQADLECCGVSGPLDYFTVLKWTSGVVAGGCCGKEKEATCLIASAHKQGCAEKVPAAVNEAIATVAYVVLGICAVEILGAVFAICLVRSK